MHAGCVLTVEISIPFFFPPGVSVRNFNSKNNFLFIVFEIKHGGICDSFRYNHVFHVNCMTLGTGVDYTKFNLD